ncbi:hypothetical protein WEI85_12110 [Actinomycetes bacterium KLBMP 9797]
MRWLRRSGVVAAGVAAMLFGVNTAAHAAPPANVGWLYTQGRSGAVFFDADLAGYPSFEKITVCDNKSDGRGILAELTQSLPDLDYLYLSLRDPSNNGDCVAQWDNYFADGYPVYVRVCEYWGTNEDNCARAEGVA